MWKISEIKISNIVSFHDAEFKVEQGVATLIFGKNEDNASQPCNGSGKSSLIEAISFALTGEQLRKVKSIDEIINDDADNAYVRLRLINDYDATQLVIERTISRYMPQLVDCHKYDEFGNEVEADKTHQPTVADYNRFILDEIGLTKSDIYNFYILCDNKYESFFDCSDKGKKELINRFSNGELVDESIERLHEDMEPVYDEVIRAKNEVMRVKGAMAAIEKELKGVKDKEADAKHQLESRLEAIKANITECREKISSWSAQMDLTKARLDRLNEIRSEIEAMEGTDMSLVEAYENLNGYCISDKLGGLTDYAELAESYRSKLGTLDVAVKTLHGAIADQEELLVQYRAELEENAGRCKKAFEEGGILDKEDEDLKSKLQKEIAEIDAALDGIESKLRDSKSKKAELENQMTKINAMINGAVTCPKCSHQFSLENGKGIVEIKADFRAVQAKIGEIDVLMGSLRKKWDELDDIAENKAEGVAAITAKMKSRTEQLGALQLAVDSCAKRINETELNISAHKRDMMNAQAEIDMINGKVEVLRSRMFAEALGLVEGLVLKGKQYGQHIEYQISFIKSQIEQFRQSKKELVEEPAIDFESSLRESLAKYADELKAVEEALSEREQSHQVLLEQEANFVQFKSYIARKKIDALSLIVNDFLEKIGSDIRLRLEGFTVTKTGKLRDKISVQVMRDGIDCGSYQKFSGGEKARLNLACILALHSLTNSDCDDGKGLDFIIIDELLDKSDEMGMSTYCEALNKLKQTALLITQGAVSESYPHRLLVVKSRGVSRIAD